MRAATTPTRRVMKQQTLLSMNTASTPPPAGDGGVAVAVDEAATAAAVAALSKRTTRAAALQTPPRSSPSSSSSQVRARAAISVAAPRTRLLRPRRTPSSSSHVGLRDPYEQHSIDLLREECVRRGISIQPRDHSDENKAALRSKTHFVELLQEADMLAMFARQSQQGRRGTKRSARLVELSPPPPLRVATAASPKRRTPSKAAATAPSLQAPASATPVAGAMSTVPGKTARPSPSRATGAKKTSGATKKKAAVKPSTTTASKVVPKTAAIANEPVAAAMKASVPPVAVVVVPARKLEVVQAPSTPKGPTVTAPSLPVVATAPPPLPAQSQPLLPHASQTVDLTLEEKATTTTAAVPVPPTTTSLPQPTTATTTTLTKPPPAPAQPPRPIAVVAAAPVLLPKAPVVVAAPVAKPSKPPSSSGTRARRGCRFRLINVVLSSDFNKRWSDMNAQAPSVGDVNAFWRDVHISYLCQNSHYDTLQFQDVLFDNVAPDAILNHTAQKLQQMWAEITMMYRRASTAASKNGEAKQFLDSCAGRLDLLYLHMGLLLKPNLQRELLAEPPRSRVVASSTQTAVAAGATTNGQVNQVAAPLPMKANAKSPSANVTKPAGPQPSHSAGKRPLKANSSTAEPQLRSTYSGPLPSDRPRYVEFQNPEMLPAWLIEDQRMTAAERDGGAAFDGLEVQGSYESTPPPTPATKPVPRAKAKAKAKAPAPKKKAPTPKPANKPASVASLPPTVAAASLDVDADGLANADGDVDVDAGAHAYDADSVQTRDLVLHSSAINSIDDESASSDYDTADPMPRPSAPPHTRRVQAKRPREPSVDAMEVPTSRELVTHQNKRLHTATAVTTTLTRSQEVMLPPDEFDTLHNRLSKIKESIDQCYRTLSNGDAILNEMHREDIESDLRFFMGIKKRIQEQIVMFMHGY